MKVALVDDEPLARELLHRMLRAHADVEVAGEAADGASALALVRAQRIDAVFLDIEMPGGGGFDVLAALERPPLVVFVTAHGHYAVRAFDVEAVDYLTKPFDEDRLATALDRLRARLAAPEPPAMIGTRARIAVRDGDATVLIALDDIECVEAAGKLVQLQLATGKTQSARETLADLEHRLDPARFVRIHRSLIVNLDHVSVIKPWFAGDQELVLTSGRTVTTGRGYRDRLLARLQR